MNHGRIISVESVPFFYFVPVSLLFDRPPSLWYWPVTPIIRELMLEEADMQRVEPTEAKRHRYQKEITP